MKLTTRRRCAAPHNKLPDMHAPSRSKRNNDKLVVVPDSRMSRSSSSLLLSNKDSLEDCMCAICISILIQPVTLPCGHEMCMGCFEQSLIEASMTCPLCRVRISSWARKSTKTKTIVNQTRWEQIQRLFPDKVQRRMNGEDDESYKEIEEKEEIQLSYLHMVQLSEPGEIRKEYEAELEKLAQQQTEERRREEEASAALIQQICSVEYEEEQKIKDTIAAQDVLLAKELEQLINEAKLKSAKKPQVTKGSFSTSQGSLTSPGTRIIQADKHHTPSHKLCHGTAEKKKSRPTHQLAKNNTTLETFFRSTSKRAAVRSHSAPVLNFTGGTSGSGKQFELSSGGWSREISGLGNSPFSNKENLLETVSPASSVDSRLSDLCIDVEVGELYFKRTDASSVDAHLSDPYIDVEVGEPYLNRTDAQGKVDVEVEESHIKSTLPHARVDVDVGEPHIKSTHPYERVDVDVGEPHIKSTHPHERVDVQAGEPHIKSTHAHERVDVDVAVPHIKSTHPHERVDVDVGEPHIKSTHPHERVDVDVGEPHIKSTHPHERVDVDVGEPHIKSTHSHERVDVDVGEPHIKSTHPHERVDVDVGEPYIKTTDTQTKTVADFTKINLGKTATRAIGEEFSEKQLRKKSVYLASNSCQRNADDISKKIARVDIVAAAAAANLVCSKRRRAASDDVLAQGSIKWSQLHTTNQADAEIGDPLENDVSCSSSFSAFSIISDRFDSELNVGTNKDQAHFKPIHPSTKTLHQNLSGNGPHKPFIVPFTISKDPSLLKSIKAQDMGNSECKKTGIERIDSKNNGYGHSAKFVESPAGSLSERHEGGVNNLRNEANGSRYSSPERSHSPAVRRHEAILDECQRSPFSRPSLTEFRIKSLSPGENEAVECGYNKTRTYEHLPNATLGSDSIDRAFQETLPSCSLQKSFLGSDGEKNVRGTLSSISAHSECASEVERFMGSRLFAPEASSQAGCPSVSATTSSLRPVGIFNPDTVPKWSEGLCSEIMGKGKRLAQKFPHSIISSRNLPKTTCKQIILQPETESKEAHSEQTLLTPQLQNRDDSDHVAMETGHCFSNDVTHRKKMMLTKSTSWSRSENPCAARALRKHSQVEKISKTAVTFYDSGAGGDGESVHGSSVICKFNSCDESKGDCCYKSASAGCMPDNVKEPGAGIKRASIRNKRGRRKRGMKSKRHAHPTEKLQTRRRRSMSLVLEYESGRKSCASSSSSDAISPERLFRKRKSSPSLLQVSKRLYQPRSYASETHNGKSSDGENKNTNKNSTSFTSLADTNVCFNRFVLTQNNSCSEKKMNIRCIKNRPEKPSTASDVSDCLVNNSPIQTRRESTSSPKRQSLRNTSTLFKTKKSPQIHKTSRPEKKRSDSVTNTCRSKGNKADFSSSTSSKLVEEESVDENLTQEEKDYHLALKLQKQFQLAERLHLNTVRFKGSDNEYCLRQREPKSFRKEKS